MTRAMIECEQPLQTMRDGRPVRRAVRRFGMPRAAVLEPSITAEVVHDFRNTLAAVSMLSELMLAEFQQIEQESPVCEIARDVRRGCADALDLCDHLLPNSGSAPSAGRPVQLSELVTRIAPLLRTYVRAPSTLRFELADDLPLQVLDSGALGRILLNLVKNAGEALGEAQGIVTVTTGWLDLQAADLPDSDEDLPQQRGRRMCLTVRDTGCGMDGRARSRLLRSAFTTKEIGHGLGMASVRRMAEQQHAHVLLQSRVGAGTTVRVVFDDAAPVDEGLPDSKMHGFRGT
jgi:two-component system cell cycle sensor histidine kinase/response regulator CckA